MNISEVPETELLRGEKFVPERTGGRERVGKVGREEGNGNEEEQGRRNKTLPCPTV